MMIKVDLHFFNKKVAWCFFIGFYAVFASANNEQNNNGYDNSYLVAEKLVHGVRQNASLACVDCHGKTGESPISADNAVQPPRLVGQDMSYLYDQLINFKEGRRYSEAMQGILNDYTDSEIQLIAHYYASQEVLIPKSPQLSSNSLTETQNEDPAWVKAGKVLYTNGDMSRGIFSCQGCHGTYGEGRIIGLDKAPKLTAQHASYIRINLENFATGKRTTDKIYNNVMQNIASKLTQDDIRNLAAYIQTLRPMENP